MKKKKIVKIEKKERMNWLLIIVMALFGMSFISSIILIANKIDMTSLLGEIRPGVMITIAILTVYCMFLILSFIQITQRKKAAVGNAIFAMIFSVVFSLWYKIIGLMIFYPDAGLMNIMRENGASFAVDVIAAGIIILYFKRSKSLKRYLTN